MFKIFVFKTYRHNRIHCKLYSKETSPKCLLCGQASGILSQNRYRSTKYFTPVSRVNNIIIYTNRQRISVHSSIPRLRISFAGKYQLPVPVKNLHCTARVTFEVWNIPNIIYPIAIWRKDIGYG